MRKNQSNTVIVCGTIVRELSFSHKVLGEGFYATELSVKRLSGVEDIVPIIVSERVIRADELNSGRIVTIHGEFRSYRKHEKEKNKLILFVFVKELFFFDDFDRNTICLDGYICKRPVYRKTSRGREIADVLLAVNRPYGKSDYIPCICWGQKANFASSLKIGTRVQFTGRIQSREYTRKISDEEFETRTAYEVSVNEMKVVYDEQD